MIERYFLGDCHPSGRHPAELKEKEMERSEAKKLVVKAGLELVRSGLIARTWGNVSCRIDEETFAVTPSGREYRTLTPEDIVEVKIKDLSYGGTIKPSSEKGIHAAVYQFFPDMNFVIHTHQENASALSAAGLDAFAPPHGFSELGESVPCAKYALPGTKALIRNVTEALKNATGHALILKHHGTLCWGGSYEDTFLAAHELETASGSYINENGGRIQSGFSDALRPLTEEAAALLTALQAAGKKGHILINTDPDVVRFSRIGSVLKPLLDDFAQIVGTKIKTVENDPASILPALKSVSAVLVKDVGAVCLGGNETDAEAVSMILRKNCKAYFSAWTFGRPQYIRPWECILMRRVYLKKYSRMDERNR
jgi:L-fuculose-phosphate aldolase